MTDDEKQKIRSESENFIKRHNYFSNVYKNNSDED